MANVAKCVRQCLLPATLAAITLSVPAATIGAQPTREITLWTARALATVLAEVGSEFEHSSGYRLHIVSDLPNGFQRRLDAGESFDLLISADATVDAWTQRGHVVADSRRPIAKSGIGVAVRAGARKPDLSTTEAFKRALLNAKSIAYLKVGSGIYMDALLDRLGIADAVKPKVLRPDTDIVAEMVAKGEAELAVVVITQILTTDGVELAGPLPPDIQSIMTFSGAISTTARSREGAQALLDFLRSPSAVRVMKAQGMQPGSLP